VQDYVFDKLNGSVEQNSYADKIINGGNVDD
jgi:hypothetical protein